VFSGTGYPSLQVTAAGSADASAQITGISVPFGEALSYAGFRLRAFAWVWTPTALLTTVSATTQTVGVSATATSSVLTRASDWTLVDVTTDPVSDSGSTTISVNVEFEGLGAGNAAFLAIPAVLSPDAIRLNVTSRETWIRLPEYVRNADLASTDPNLALLRFIEVLTSVGDAVDETWENFRYIPPDDNLGEAKASTLTNPSIATESVLKWLAPLVGTQLFNPFSGFTPWENIVAGADANLDDVMTWDEFEGGIDTDESGDLTWSEIENYNPSITGLSAFEAWQVSGAAYGLRGGTVDSIKSAAKQAFIGAEPDVEVTGHYGDDPFAIAVTVAGSTEDDIGKIEEFVSPAMPAGFGLTVLADV
jgi:hypothetical protein